MWVAKRQTDKENGTEKDKVYGQKIDINQQSHRRGWRRREKLRFARIILER